MASARTWNCVYLGYMLVDRGGTMSTIPLTQKGKSFIDAKKRLIELANDFAVECPAMMCTFYLRRGDVAALVNSTNLADLLGKPKRTDVAVYNVVPTEGGSRVVAVPRAKPVKKAQKTFVASAILRGALQHFPVRATNYMGAREEVLRVAAAFACDNPNDGASFSIRNQIVAQGQTVAGLVNVPSKRTELLVELSPSGDGPWAMRRFPGGLNKAYKPNQHLQDEKVFVGELLDLLPEELRATAKARG